MSTVPNERRYGGKTRDERQEDRRARLLDAGLELFGTRGYSATSIEAICAHARLNARYFYEAFGTREDLLRAVYDRHVATVFGAVIGALADASADLADQLRAGLDAFVELTLADPRATRINYLEMVGVSVALEARRREVLTSYADMIATRIAGSLGSAVAVPGGDPRFLAIALVSAVDGLIIDRLGVTAWQAPGAAPGLSPEARGELVATLVAIFSAALPRSD